MSEYVGRVPAALRPTLNAGRRAIKAAAPGVPMRGTA